VTKLLKNTINKTINSIIICSLFAPDWRSLALNYMFVRCPSSCGLFTSCNKCPCIRQCEQHAGNGISMRAIHTAGSSLADSPRRNENRSSTSCKLQRRRSHLLIHRQKEQVADCSDFKTDMVSGAAARSYIHPHSN
jgi:hypothetical protein